MAAPEPSRRALLTGGAIGAGGLAASLAAGLLSREEPDAGAPVTDVVPFRGAHQAGITTPAQDRLHFATFDVTTDDRDALIAMLRDWTAAAEQMSAGHEAGQFGATSGPYDAPPQDTGEAIGLPAAHLTLTIGFGPSLFTDADGAPRFGLDGKLPAALRELPLFPGDQLEPARCGGDIAVQACSDDPQVAVHAIRNLARIGFGTVAVRWSQLGYGRTSSTSTSQETPRNLFGFKDGTANLKAEDTAAVDRSVWVSGGDQPWLEGGSYLVARRIRMHIETWDRASLREQEGVIGRTKAAGAPLSGGTEFTEPDFTLAGRGDEPLIDPASHVAMTHPSANDGAAMLRRGYNYTDGSDGLGRLDAGLFFIAYVADPDTQYIPMQTRIARGDRLSEYLRHTGSGLWAVPGGLAPGQYWGQALFEG